MPELPEVTPWVPQPPDLPDLPPELPWPPDFEWPDIDIGPWVPPPFPPWDFDDGLPACYAEFARRLMNLMFAVAAFRAANGQTQGFPPFDLRLWYYATPQLVNLAILWFVTMWNTLEVSGEEPEPEWVYGSPRALTNGAQYRLGSPTHISQSGTAVAGWSWGNKYASYVKFTMGTPIAGGTKIARAALVLNTASSNGLNLLMDCHDSVTPAVPANTSAYLGVPKTGSTTLWQTTGYGSPAITPDVTAAVQHVIDKDGFAGDIGMTFDQIGDAGILSFYYWSNVLQYTALAINVAQSPLAPVDPITVLTLSKLDCGQMMAWLSRVEAICWPYLQENA